MTKSISYTKRYTTYGALFGLVFPIVAFLLRLFQYGFSGAINNVTTDPLFWIIASAPLFLGTFAHLGGVRQDRLVVKVQEISALADQRDNLVKNLEQRISDRTALLQKRAAQLQTAGEVARDVLVAKDMDGTLNLAVNLIKDRFGYYHAGIFLVDEHEEYAVLRAATGDAGATLLQRGHRLKIGETGIVGYVAARGLPRVALDVVTDVNYFKNPALPLTRSEMALPLKINERVIGVLDVQSTTAAAFSQDDISTIQTMADQLAVAIDKARLVEQLETKTHELETAQREATAGDWQEFLARSRRSFGYRFRSNRLQEVSDQPIEASQAFSENRLVVASINSDPSNALTSLAVPIAIRSQVVGVLNLRFAAPSVDQPTIRLIENIASRLSLAIENARLLEDNQRRAEREHKVSEITTKVRASSDIDQILRTAIEELGRTLGATQAVIQLKTEEPEAEVS